MRHLILERLHGVIVVVSWDFYIRAFYITFVVLATLSANNTFPTPTGPTYSRIVTLRFSLCPHAL